MQGTKSGVSDGARTHDNRNHNPGLYQLSYTHHCLLQENGVDNPVLEKDRNSTVFIFLVKKNLWFTLAPGQFSYHPDRRERLLRSGYHQDDKPCVFVHQSACDRWHQTDNNHFLAM